MSLPEQFGRYEVIGVLGQGAMGLVYKAVDPVIERAVAVKVIQPDVGLSAADLERMRARFEQEFRSAGALSHSNIVTVFDVGKEGDFYYIAMEYVEGRSLDNVLEERRVLTFEELGQLAAQLGAALDYAHGEGVVHRDIKPANVLLTLDGTAKITDFGLAKLGATTLTRTGALVGTPAYMSPEQVNGHSITGRSDQFSLAVLLYLALTGERPFTGDSPQTLMYKIVHDEPVLPRIVNPALPEPVDRVIARALAKAPDQRHPSCLDFAASLTHALGSPVSITGAADPTVVVAGGLATTADELAPTDPVVPVAVVTDQTEPLQQPVPAASAPSTAPSGASSQVVGHGTPPGEPPYGAPAMPGTPPPGDSASALTPAPRGAPTWLLALAVVLPSLALIAVVAWLVMSGVIGGQTPAAGNESLVAGGVEETLQNPDAGAEAAATGGDTEAGTENDSATPQAATPEDVQAITDELRNEFQQLADEVRDSRASPQPGEPAAAEPPPDDRAQDQPAEPEPQPVSTPARPAAVDYSITSDPSGALIRVDGRNTGQVTPASVRLGTNSDHEVQVLQRGYEATRYQIRMAGVPFADLPVSLHVTMVRTTAANRGDARGGARLPNNLRVREGIPEELQRLIDSGRVHTGAVVVSSPFAVALRIAPADRSVIPAEMQERIRNAATQEEQRRISASVMAGFLMPEAEEHRIELPVGNWRVNVLALHLLLNHAQPVVVRAASDARVEFATRVVSVVIESDPRGARVRVNGLVPISTPYRGSMVVGDHEFQFIWGDQTSMTRAKIERDGQTIIGRRRQ